MNTAINPVAEKVLRLLLEKGPGAASDYVRTVLEPEVARAQKVFDDAKDAKMVAENIIALSSRPRVGAVQAALESNEALSLADRAQARVQAAEPESQDEARRTAILTAANEIADKKEEVTTVAVVMALHGRGFNLAGARPGTSVGNVLLRAPGWVRVGEGKFKREPAHA